MKIKLLGITLTAFLAGCSLTPPSFYDDNESMLAVEVRYEIDRLDCNNIDPYAIARIDWQVHKFMLYSESKGSSDVTEMLVELKKTSGGLAQKENVSTTYCNLKKKSLAAQSASIAEAVMWRY